MTQSPQEKLDSMKDSLNYAMYKIHEKGDKGLNLSKHGKTYSALDDALTTLESLEADIASEEMVEKRVDYITDNYENMEKTVEGLRKKLKESYKRGIESNTAYDVLEKEYEMLLKKFQAINTKR